MQRRTLSLLLLSLLLVTLSQRTFATEIPFAFRDGLLWLKVTAPHQTAPLNFLLDSGASATVVDLATARGLGMKSRSTVDVAGVHTRSVAYEWNDFTASVGGLALPRHVLAVDLSNISRACHQRIDGLVGADFFRKRIVQIDYGRGVVRVFPRREAPLMVGAELPISIRNDAMCVRVAPDGRHAEWTRVDTGCDAELHWVAASKSTGRLGRNSIAATTTSGRSVSLPVRIGSEHLPCVKTTLHSRAIFPGENGLLGNGVLSRFVVTFDRDGKRLLLARR